MVLDGCQYSYVLDNLIQSNFLSLRPEIT